MHMLFRSNYDNELDNALEAQLGCESTLTILDALELIISDVSTSLLEVEMCCLLRNHLSWPACAGIINCHFVAAWTSSTLFSCISLLEFSI